MYPFLFCFLATESFCSEPYVFKFVEKIQKESQYTKQKHYK